MKSSADERCLHWDAILETQGEVVHKTCPDCGASGVYPRCAGTAARTGERCRRRADGDGKRCRMHVTQLVPV